jgi:cysteine synthase
MNLGTETFTALLEAYGPQLIPLSDNLVAACFPLMKVYPAEYCVRRAMRNGQINSDTLIVESSSGTLALGLATVCNWLDLPLVIVTDYACDDVLKRRIEDLGAKVERVPAPAAVGGYQRARLDRLKEICDSTPPHWWLNQYDNPGNAASYSKFAAQLVESLGAVDCLVGTVGSGGSVCGTAIYLRELFPEMTVIGVDTFHSVLFGYADGPRPLRGLGNSLLPKNLDHTAFNEVHWVTAGEAYTATRLLHRQTSLFRGGTSGAAWMVARYWAEKHPRKKVVCLFPDDGTRYVHDIYSDDYMGRNGYWQELPTEPDFVSSPGQAVGRWTAMDWGRRHYAETVAGVCRK